MSALRSIAGLILKHKNKTKRFFISYQKHTQRLSATEVTKFQIATLRFRDNTTYSQINIIIFLQHPPLIIQLYLIPAQSATYFPYFRPGVSSSCLIWPSLGYLEKINKPSEAAPEAFFSCAHATTS